MRLFLPFLPARWGWVFFLCLGGGSVLGVRAQPRHVVPLHPPRPLSLPAALAQVTTWVEVDSVQPRRADGLRLTLVVHNEGATDVRLASPLRAIYLTLQDHLGQQVQPRPVLQQGLVCATKAGEQLLVEALVQDLGLAWVQLNEQAQQVLAFAQAADVRLPAKGTLRLGLGVPYHRSLVQASGEKRGGLPLVADRYLLRLQVVLIPAPFQPGSIAQLLAPPVVIQYGRP
jgi:hypothetical protein